MLQKILNDTVAADQKALDANQGAYDAGTGDYISVVEARSTLQAAQAAAVNVGLLRAQYEHAIAVLLARFPLISRFRSSPWFTRRRRFPPAFPLNLSNGGPTLPPPNARWPGPMQPSALDMARFSRRSQFLPAEDLSPRLSSICSTGRAASGRSGRRLRRLSLTVACTAPSCTVHGHVQCGPRHLPSERAHSVPAGRGLAGCHASLFAADSRRTGSDEVGPAVSRSGNPALQLRRRPLYRCGYSADDSARRSAVTEYAPG